MGSNIFTSSSSIHSSGDVRDCIYVIASEKGSQFCSRGVVSDVKNRGIVAEKGLELLNKPKHNDDEDGVEDLKLRVCDARQACGGDCDNDFPKDFREDVEWNAFAFSWTLLENGVGKEDSNEEWIDVSRRLMKSGLLTQEERQVGYLGWYFEASIFTVNSLYKFSWRPVNKKVLTHQRVFVASNLRPGCSADEFFIMGCGGVGRCWGLHGMICCYIGHARVQESR
ncbi:hypothetical protein Bca4012_026937 [Brassica carinata]